MGSRVLGTRAQMQAAFTNDQTLGKPLKLFRPPFISSPANCKDLLGRVAMEMRGEVLTATVITLTMH